MGRGGGPASGQGQQRREGSEPGVCPPPRPRPLGGTRPRPLCLGRGAGPCGRPPGQARTAILLLGPTQKADKFRAQGLLPLPQAARRRQPAQPEAGRSPGQLALVTLYPTQGTLRTRNREQRSWRRYKASLVTCAQPQPAPRLLWAPGPALCAPGPQPLLPGRPATASMPLTVSAPPPPCPPLCGWRARLSACISEWLGSVREAPDLLCDSNQVSGPLWASVSLPACWGQTSHLRPISLGLSGRRGLVAAATPPPRPHISSQACFLGGPAPWGLAHMR